MKKKSDNRISVNWEFVLNAESVHREWEVPTLPSTKHPVIKRLKAFGKKDGISVSYSMNKQNGWQT